jgi:hypothetical protein
MDLGTTLTIAVIALLWIAAAAFGSDTRDGRDWFSRVSLRGRPPRTGD